MSYDETKGRVLRSVSKIESATTLIVENAYTHWLRPSLYKSYCYACLKSLTKRYLYCGKCFKVRFCCVQCLNKSTNEFHKNECEYMNILEQFSMGHFALRMASVVGIDVVLQTAFENERQQNCDHFKNDYKSIYSLTGDRRLQHSTLFLSACVGGAVLALCAHRMSWITNKSEEMEVFAGVMFKHLMQVIVNTFVVYDCKMKKSDLTVIHEDSFLGRKRKKVGVVIAVQTIA
ncbi:SET and MYND domain-containing protein 4-like protein [Leptotrombidium deliense]|uniref:SET and MYND domain-containing protein 4-like protein n=1 Tax=Leptotrombidium deliense TaxID=299467 RepID=A0A443S6I4_9ACAR|nr:SET and MYND domain-containing protein 4-like protein [Leptotrombidium deliense]